VNAHTYRVCKATSSALYTHTHHAGERDFSALPVEKKEDSHGSHGSELGSVQGKYGDYLAYARYGKAWRAIKQRQAHTKHFMCVCVRLMRDTLYAN
jgi:hypothetical protein